MNDELDRFLKLAEEAVKGAVEAGASHAEAVAGRSRGIAVMVENSSVKSAESGHGESLSIRAFVEGACAHLSVEGLRDAEPAAVNVHVRQEDKVEPVRLIHRPEREIGGGSLHRRADRHEKPVCPPATRRGHKLFRSASGPHREPVAAAGIGSRHTASVGNQNATERLPVSEHPSADRMFPAGGPQARDARLH